MRHLPLQAIGSIVVSVGYVLAVVLVIAVLCVGVVKLLGGRVGRHPQEQGTTGVASETLDPEDGTPHER